MLRFPSMFFVTVPGLRTYGIVERNEAIHCNRGLVSEAARGRRVHQWWRPVRRGRDMSVQRDPAEDDALRNEIQAAIAAGRELGPDMDRHLADSVLDRYRKEQAARQTALAPQPAPRVPARPHDMEALGRTIL